jgi:hypothetical protein
MPEASDNTFVFVCSSYSSHKGKSPPVPPTATTHTMTPGDPALKQRHQPNNIIVIIVNNNATSAAVAVAAVAAATARNTSLERWRALQTCARKPVYTTHAHFWVPLDAC